MTNCANPGVIMIKNSRWWGGSEYRGGVRHGQQKHRELRRAREHAEEELGSTQGKYKPPDRDECHAKEWESAVDDLYTVRLYYRTWRFDGRLVDFVIKVELRTANGWTELERVDCCHGHCHLHHDNDEKTPQSLHRLDELEDVEKAFRSMNPLADERARIIRDKGV